MSKTSQFKKDCNDDSNYVAQIGTTKTAKIKKMCYLVVHRHRVTALTSNITPFGFFRYFK